MKKVLVLCGGNSSEHNVSLVSAKSILNNIDNSLFQVSTVVIDYDYNWYEYGGKVDCLSDWKHQEYEHIDNIVDYLKMFDVIFPITHGTNGEDGKLQGMLDLFDIKYVGCKTSTSAICMDKDFSKMIFSHLGIPQIPFITISNQKFKIHDIIKKLGLPLIVKPANGGSSIGISKASNKKELKKAIIEAFKYDDKIVIEKFIKARELECGLLEDKDFYISEVGEITSANEFYDYNAKYKNKKSYTTIPANLKKEVKDKIIKYTKTAFDGINGRGFARIDFLYDEDNEQLYLNEINTLPGFTEISMYPKLFIYSGIEYKDLITKLINNC